MKSLYLIIILALLWAAGCSKETIEKVPSYVGNYDFHIHKTSYYHSPTGSCYEDTTYNFYGQIAQYTDTRILIKFSDYSPTIGYQMDGVSVYTEYWISPVHDRATDSLFLIRGNHYKSGTGHLIAPDSIYFELFVREKNYGRTYYISGKKQ
jgi:hypothetical protein